MSYLIAAHLDTRENYSLWSVEASKSGRVVTLVGF